MPYIIHEDNVSTWEGAALRDGKVHPQKGQTLVKLLAVVGLLGGCCPTLLKIVCNLAHTFARCRGNGVLWTLLCSSTH